MTPAEPVPFTAGDGLAIKGETAGEGPPIVLCHGLTATRDSVVHGSRALERAGYRQVSYDARGHGESDPAPAGEGYGYPELAGDLESVVAAEVGEEPFVLVGSSMGAHTAVAFSLHSPERLAGLVLIGPVYRGAIDEAELAYWDGLATALETGGVDGFVEYIDRFQAADPAWRESILRFTRERMLRHRHLDAVAEALRQVARSQPFGEMAELESVQAPALVVASHDDADLGHPRAVAEAYAERLPLARLVGESEGESPLAWQGGRLSREIAAFSAPLTGRSER
ncbi:MAG TPA: alpha/beta fold hydrolase [Solirubrobacterales bacterium]|nr:alpha/beta fold hydrolase [Solirubrobacterales bacterium]